MSLCLRNIGGQLVGATSRSVFGQPARAAGLCFGEWEERSPWPPLATRLGFDDGDDVVTVHAGMGTHAMADINCDDDRELVRLLAKSISYPLGNKFLSPTAGNGQVVLAINPEWARRFGTTFPDAADLQAYLWEHAWQPIDLWPDSGQAILEGKGRVDDQGRVWLNERPDQIAVVGVRRARKPPRRRPAELGRQRDGCRAGWSRRGLTPPLPLRLDAIVAEGGGPGRCRTRSRRPVATGAGAVGRERGRRGRPAPAGRGGLR